MCGLDVIRGIPGVEMSKQTLVRVGLQREDEEEKGKSHQQQR